MSTTAEFSMREFLTLNEVTIENDQPEGEIIEVSELKQLICERFEFLKKIYMNVLYYLLIIVDPLNLFQECFFVVFGSLKLNISNFLFKNQFLYLSSRCDTLSEITTLL